MHDLENPMVSGYGFKDYLTDPPKTAFYCDDCDEPICEGERYICVCGQRVCETCVDNSWEIAEAETECMDFEEE